MSYCFRSEVLETSELVECAPSSLPACPVVPRLVEVALLGDYLRDFNLVQERRRGEKEEVGRGSGKREERGKRERKR